MKRTQGWGDPGDCLYVPEKNLIVQIRSVHVERLQTITEREVQLEGLNLPIEVPFIEGFRAYWDKIYRDEGYGWETDPEVWVIEFRLI